MNLTDFRKDLALLILDLDLGIQPAADLAHRASVLLTVERYGIKRWDAATRRSIEACKDDLYAANPCACAAERTWLKNELHRAFESLSIVELAPDA